MLFLVIHVFAAIWIRLGHESSDSWARSYAPYAQKDDLRFDTYITGVYFITTTITTIGYGDWLAHTNSEYAFVMLLELLGLALFSYILGTFQTIQNHQSAIKIIEAKKEEITNFLIDVNKANKKVELPYEIFYDTEKYLDILYSHQVKYIMNMDGFYDELIPACRNQIAFEWLKNEYIKFKFFFYDPILNFQAPDKFINDWLINFEPFVFMPDRTIISRTEYMDYVYFVVDGIVLIKDYANKNPVIVLEQGDYFGDYQAIFETRSNFTYETDKHHEAILFGLEKEKFISLVKEYDDLLDFYTGRAVVRRRIFRKIQKYFMQVDMKKVINTIGMNFISSTLPIPVKLIPDHWLSPREEDKENQETVADRVIHKSHEENINLKSETIHDDDTENKGKFSYAFFQIFNFKNC